MSDDQSLDVDALLERVARLEQKIEIQSGAVAALMQLALMRPTALSWYDTPDGGDFKARLAAPLELEGVVAKAQLGHLRQAEPQGHSEMFVLGWRAVTEDLARALQLWQGPLTPAQ
ncbi:hypothetical protein [Caulobacter sp. 17J65-9]|uniref:hypothetical protein n=1 Tax=Caulobacter sp. 17J65-9 TaxID=2709382 RepID=UPI0013CB7933|nr:hypothetical protein [Caulobacter sp. 17J65-9]NEX93382.1 hypothetical protein [Caulobacter sp. 17J65-9]